MAKKSDLQTWIVDALTELGGSAAIPEVCKWVWDRHEGELRDSGDLFYTWQYDIRWAAHRLRRKGALSGSGTWRLV
jgi:hypothetical protein